MYFYLSNMSLGNLIASTQRRFAALRLSLYLFIVKIGFIFQVIAVAMCKTCSLLISTFRCLLLHLHLDFTSFQILHHSENKLFLLVSFSFLFLVSPSVYTCTQANFPNISFLSGNRHMD